MALPKWTDERTAQLTAFVGDESPVSQDTVAQAADQLETSTRSVSSKLRKMGYEVELASARSSRAFSADQEATLAAFVSDNSGEYTYAQIAEHFEGGAVSAKSIQGKILSMELTDHVKPAPKVETVRTYSPEEESKFISMVNDGAFVEAIAEALDRSVNSVRGKALSLLRSGEIDAIPRQEHTKGGAKEDPLADLGDVSGMTVEEIAEAIGKTARGVKTMLTRRGISAADYDGAAKKEKAAN
jgi:DNA-binding transcriptional ArsR family regulator